MKWENTESTAYSGNADNPPATVEVMDLKDRNGAVLKRFAKDAAGELTELTQSYTAPVSRVVVGTIDTALSGVAVVLQFGDLRITTGGGDVAVDDDGTELIPYLAANAYLIPAESVVDNEDQTFDITFFPGANTIPLVSGDAALTFDETVEGADAVYELVANGGILTYDAILSQTTTGDPAVVALSPNNGIEDVVWTRFTEGIFVGTLADAFPVGRTFIHVDTGGNLNYTTRVLREGESPDTVLILPYDADGESVDVDGTLYVHIEVWPA